MTRLRHLAAINPLTPEFERLSATAELPFVPLEAVWSHGLDLSRRRTRAEVVTGYTRFREGDILLPKITPTFQADRTVIAEGLTSGVAAGTTELHVIRVDERAEARYIRYLLSSRPFLHGGEAEMIGVAGQKRVPDDWLRNLTVPVLERQQQRLIADFLDAETARIDALIAKKRHLQRALALRTTALRSNVFSTQPTQRLKRLLRARMAYGVLVPRFSDGDTSARMIRINALTLDGCIDPARLAYIEPAQSDEYSRTVVCEGDLVLSVVGSMGRSAVIDDESAGSNLNRPLARLQPRRELPAWLLWHWSKTPQFLDQAWLATGGDTAQPTLNLGDLAEFAVGLPDDPAAWTLLLQDLERQIAPIGTAQGVLTRQIALMRERRQALITAAVTGELPIPGAAA